MENRKEKPAPKSSSKIATFVPRELAEKIKLKAERFKEAENLYR